VADRGASSTITGELAAAQNRPVHLFEVYLDTGTVYITDAPFQITWNGNAYLANGHLLGFDAIEEDTNLHISTTTVELTGCDASGPTWVASVLAEEYIDRRVIIRTALLHGAGGVLDAPILIFDGRMDQPVIDDDPVNGTCRVSITASSQFADFERVIGRRTNDSVQQLHFSGDKFFEFASEIPLKVIVWGRPG
jgi:hypothetical protein